MNETFLIESLKPDTHAPGKVKEAAKPAGDASFAAELSASSLMLQYFELNSRPSLAGELGSSVNLERINRDQALEGKITERDENFLREAKLEFNEGERTTRIEKDIISDDKSAKAQALKEQSLDDSLDVKSAKAEVFSEELEQSSEAKRSEEKSTESKEVKLGQGKTGNAVAQKGEQRSIKDSLPSTLKPAQAESAEKLESTGEKGAPKNITQAANGSTAPQPLALELSKEAQPGVLGKSAPGAGGVNLVEGAGVEQVKSSPGALISGTSINTANATQSGTVAKAAPVTRSSAFDSFLVRQVASKMAVIFKNNVSTAKLTLNPPELGKLRVEIIMEGTKVKATIATENVIVRDALEANLPLLKESLASQGLSVNDLNIVLSDGSGGNDSASGNSPWRRGANSKGKDEDGAHGASRAQRTLNNDGLDIFI